MKKNYGRLPLIMEFYNITLDIRKFLPSFFQKAEIMLFRFSEPISIARRVGSMPSNSRET